VKCARDRSDRQTAVRLTNSDLPIGAGRQRGERCPTRQELRPARLPLRTTVPGRMTEPDGTSALVERFLASFNGGDLAAMRDVLADDAVAYITGPDGEPMVLNGASAYTAALEAMHLTDVDYSVTLTQAPVMVGEDQVLIMVEVRATREAKTLHNFAAHLLRIMDGRVVEMFMVDAKPAESDAFWA
jgi:ketosteroid isomerase-like protein